MLGSGGSGDGIQDLTHAKQTECCQTIVSNFSMLEQKWSPVGIHGGSSGAISGSLPTPPNAKICRHSTSLYKITHCLFRAFTHPSTYFKALPNDFFTERHSDVTKRPPPRVTEGILTTENTLYSFLRQTLFPEYFGPTVGWVWTCRFRGLKMFHSDHRHPNHRDLEARSGLHGH